MVFNAWVMQWINQFTLNVSMKAWRLLKRIYSSHIHIVHVRWWNVWISTIIHLSLAFLHDDICFSIAAWLNATDGRRVGCLRLEEADSTGAEWFCISRHQTFSFWLPLSILLDIDRAKNWKWQYFKFGLRLMSENLLMLFIVHVRPLITF